MINAELNSAIRHLRLHFSLLLMPVFLFALSQAEMASVGQAGLVFVMLHLLVYPASNAFNSYHDRDTGSIGGMEHPPPVNNLVLLLANFFDLLALLLSVILLPHLFTIMVFGYIAFSRLYSHRAVRLKQYAIPAFSVVFIFQGGYTFLMVWFGLDQPWHPSLVWAILAASMQIGAAYPLTQVYQHQADREDGVISLSARLGYRGTFVFSGLMFFMALIAYAMFFSVHSPFSSFYLLLIFQIPVLLYFTWWIKGVWQTPSFANYRNTMNMSVLSATTMNLCFLTLYLIKYFGILN